MYSDGRAHAGSTSVSCYVFSAVTLAEPQPLGHRVSGVWMLNQPTEITASVERSHALVRGMTTTYTVLPGASGSLSFVTWCDLTAGLLRVPFLGGFIFGIPPNPNQRCDALP